MIRSLAMPQLLRESLDTFEVKSSISDAEILARFGCSLIALTWLSTCLSES